MVGVPLIMTDDTVCICAQEVLMIFCGVRAAECFIVFFLSGMCMTEYLVAAVISSTVEGFGCGAGVSTRFGAAQD